jgi:hypothetical protein
VTLTYPDVYAPSRLSQPCVAFRSGRFTLLILRWVDEQEGRSAGLRFSTAPAEEISVGGGGEKW